MERGFKVIYLIGFILILLVVGVVAQGYSFNPNDNRLIGYEFLDNNEVVHIWNTQDDYFFETDAGIQLTNHYEDYWTRNIFCIGYYSGEEWIKIKCSDELNSFNKNIETDNETYVNATLWKDIEYEGYDLRLGIQYHLGLSDETLSITIYGKNIGDDIPFDLGFAWKITDVNIPEENTDEIIINNSHYKLDGYFDLTFKDMKHTYINYTTIETQEIVDNETGQVIVDSSTEIINNGIITEKTPFFKVFDYDDSLKLYWDENLNYVVKMYGNGNQEDFYIVTLINAGHFNPNQEKSTTFQWIDLTDKNWYVNLSINASLTDIGDWSSPDVFFMDESWYMISAEYDGVFNGYVYNEGDRDWDTNTTIKNGLSDVGTFGTQTVFYKDESWYLITGAYDGTYDGYTWTGLGWTANTSIKAGLVDPGLISTPTTAYWHDNWYLISGDGDGNLYGYTWTYGSNTWTSNSTIISSLPNMGLRTIPYMFEMNGSLYSLMSTGGGGSDPGSYSGFKFVNNDWVDDFDINASISEYISGNAFMFPSVYFKDADWNMLSGYVDATFKGYTYFETGIPVVYDLNITNSTEANPHSVSSGDNLTLSFNFTSDNVSLTTGVTMENVTIGGSYATIWGEEGSIGDFPVFVDAGSIVADITVPISVTLTCPSYLENDILIASWWNGGGDPVTISTGDWTEIQSLVGTDDAGWFWQRAAGSGTSGGTFTSVDDDAFMICYVIRGAVTTGDPFDTGWAVTDNTASQDTTPSTAQIDTLDVNRVVMNFHNALDDTGWNTGPLPSGWEFQDNQVINAGVDSQFTVSSKNETSATTVTSAVIGTMATTEYSASLTIAFKPAITPATQEFAFYDDFWNVNISAPTFESGLKDLYINATYSGNTENDTETNAINYGGAAGSCATVVGDEWYVPNGCECYCEAESINLNECSCVGG